MATRWSFNPKRFLGVCAILMGSNVQEPECIYRSVINRCYLVALQVAAFHILSRGRYLPDNSDYYREVREKLLEVGVDANLTDDLNDLQDMRVKADYRYTSVISQDKADYSMTIATHIINELDSQFPDSCL